MKRIMIIGGGGAGKSTLALKLGQRLGLPVVHLDQEFWQPGWVQPPNEMWDERLRELVARERWIMDGNYGRTQEMRMQRADTIVVLNFPGWLCVWRVFQRVFKSYGKVRPDLAPGCPEQLPDLEFLLWIWRFGRWSLPALMARLEKYRVGRQVFVLAGPWEVRRFLASDFEE